MMGKWLALAVTLIIAALVGFAAARPPAPVPATAAADRFSAQRAMADVRIIAREPHPTGSIANEAARAYLVDRLKSLGFEVRTTIVPLPEKSRARMASRGAPAQNAVNIIALRPGRDPAAPAVLLMAHYDSVPGSPGAADDASGVASALEIARAIPRETQARDLIILLTDAEEAGLNGARDFFGRHGDAPDTLGDPLAGRTGVVINLEARGGGGRAMMFETGPGNGNMASLFARVVKDPAASSLAVKIYELLPNNTDFTPAKKRGIAGFNFAFLGGAWQYHSPLATPDALDQGSLQHMGAQALDLTRALLTEPALPAAAPDKVFGDVLGQFVLAYPPVIGWAFIIASAALLVIAARRRSADWTWRKIIGGMLDGIGYTLVAAVLLYGGNLLSGADGKTNYYDRLAALPRLEVQALLLMAGALALMIGIAGRNRVGWGNWVGLASLNLAIAATAQALLPAAAPIFAWPLLIAMLAILPASRSGTIGGIALVPLMVAAILGLAFTSGFAHFTMLGVGITMPSAVAVFAPLVLLLLAPLLPVMTRRTAFAAALVLVIGAGAIALWVRLDPIAPSVAAYADSKS